MSIHPLFLPSSFTWSNPVPTVLQLQYKTHLLTLGKPTKTILIDLDQTIIRSRAKFPSKDPKDWTYINEHVKRTLRKYAGVMQGGTEKKVHDTNGKRRREEGDSSVAQKDMQEEVKSKCPKTETATQDKQAKRASETQEATSATSPGKEALHTTSSTEEIDTRSTDHYNIIIITNQGGHKVQSRQVTWKKKCELICKDLDIPITILAAVAYDRYRKPQTGLLDIVNSCGYKIDMPNSLFVGDAAGRPKDHTDTDRKFAINAGLRFETPEQFFLGKPEEPYVLYGYSNATPCIAANESIYPEARTDGKCELIVCIGMPGSGKSTFAQMWEKVHGYARVNMDTLRTQDKCLANVRTYLEKGIKTIVDNTNSSTVVRSRYIAIARKCNVPVRAFWFNRDRDFCEHANQVRGCKGGPVVPLIAYNTYLSRFNVPTKDEGFMSVEEVPFLLNDATEEHIWNRWYL